MPAASPTLLDVYGVVSRKAAEEVDELKRQAREAVIHAEVTVDDHPEETVVLDLTDVVGQRLKASPKPLVDIADEDFYAGLGVDPLQPLQLGDAGPVDIPPTDPYKVADLQISPQQLRSICPEADYTVVWDLKLALEKARAAVDAYFTPIVMHCDTQLALPADFKCPTTIVDQLDQPSTRAPVAHIHDGLNFMRHMSEKVMSDCQRLAQLKAADLMDHISELETQLQQRISKTDHSVVAAVAPRDMTTHGLKHAWGTSWWTREKRERSSRYVDGQLQQWERDEEKDSLAEDLFDAIERQFAQYLQLLEIEKQLGMEEDVRATLAAMQQGAETIRAMDREAKFHLALAQADLVRLSNVVAELKGVEPLRREESERHIVAHSKTVHHIHQDRLTTAQEIVVETKRFREQKLHLEEALRRVGFSPQELQLKDEIEALRQLLAVAQRELRMREDCWRKAEARREAEWTAAHTREVERLRGELHAAEEQCRQRLTAFHNELQALRLRRCKSLHDHVALGLAEKKRIAHTQTLTGACEQLAVQLQRCCDVLRVDVEVLFKASEVTNSLIGGIQGYFDHLRQKCTEEMPVLCLRALDLGARLTDWQATLEVDKQGRILAMDHVLQNQIQMLEFYVDTKDPLAHKHQVIISELQALRLQNEQDIQTHEDLRAKYYRKCRQVDRFLSQLLNDNEEDKLQSLPQYRVLQQRWPDFFRGMAAVDPAGSTLGSTFLASFLELPPPPRSTTVAMKFTLGSTLPELSAVGSPAPSTAPPFDAAVGVDDFPSALAKGKGRVPPPPHQGTAAADVVSHAAASEIADISVDDLPQPAARADGSHGDPLFGEFSSPLARGREELHTPGSTYVQQLRSEIEALRRQLAQRDPDDSAMSSTPCPVGVGRSLADELLQELRQDEVTGLSASFIPQSPDSRSAVDPSLSLSASSRSKRHRLNKQSMLQIPPDAVFDHRQFRLMR
eukprot:GGOE01019568.1.p1 GENE.GGOE01019568.1~~GGOE01019568.1.p1  ORF type:complete len:962 (-),score=314.57 GGOE01019568.1:24-2909(-)